MEQKFLVTAINTVIFVGKDRYKEKKTVFTNPLHSQELIFIFSGRSVVHFNGKTLETTANTLRYLPKGPCSEYTVERDEPGDCIDIFFQTDKPLAPEAFVLKVTENSRIGSLFRKMFATWVGKGSGYYFECVSLLYKIFAELQKQNYIPEKQYRSIKPALDYIERHFLDMDISMEELASLCAISYSYLKKIFISKFGVPPKKYINQLKLNYACDLLKTERYSITQTAEMCGFSGIHFFSRQFKEYVGISPSEFARKHNAAT